MAGAHPAEPAAAGERAVHRLADEFAGAGLQGRCRVGSATADLQAACSAPSKNDLAGGALINDRIYPLARAFYADLLVDMHNRMKEALVLLGRLPLAAVRPPLVKLGAAEIERIRLALVDAGLLDRRASRAA